MKKSLNMKNRCIACSLLLAILLLTDCSDNKQASKPATAQAPKKTIILAVDGGGIKGIIPAVFLDSIEARTKKQSFQLFDLIGGTSTGGIIAAALTTQNTRKGALPFTAADLVNMYNTSGNRIFVPQPSTCALCATYYASNDNKGIEPFLQSLLPAGLSLSDSKKHLDSLGGHRVKQMFTTTYVVNSTGGSVSKPVEGKDYGPYLFNWYDASADAADDYFVWEAARGTSAAPTFFPIAHVGGNNTPRSEAAEKWVVDGGMMSNDPAIWGMTEAFRTGLATRLEDIIIISLGTGLYPGDAGVGISTNSSGWFGYPKDGNWSSTLWVASPMYNLSGYENSDGTIINIILDAVQMASDNQLRELQKSGLTYLRLEPTLTQGQSQMDNISQDNIKSLIKSAQDYIAAGEGKATLDSIVTALNTY